MTLWRFVTGLGMGGVTPLATTLISEWTSGSVRASSSLRDLLGAGGRRTGRLGDRSCGVAADVPDRRPGAAGAVRRVSATCCPNRRSTWRSTLPCTATRTLAEPPGGREALRRHRELHRAGGGKRSATGWRRSGTATTGARRLSHLAGVLVQQLRAVHVHELLEGAARLPAAGEGKSRIGAVSLFSLGAFFGSIGGAFLIRWYGSRYVGSSLAFIGALPPP